MTVSVNWKTQFDWSLGLSSVSCYSTVMLLNAAQSGPAQSSCPAVPQTTILLLPGPSKFTCSIYNYRKVPHIHCQLHADADYPRAVSTSVRPTDDVCSLCQLRMVEPKYCPITGHLLANISYLHHHFWDVCNTKCYQDCVGKVAGHVHSH